MSADVWLEETYFDWLKSEAFSLQGERQAYEGVLRELHDIPFVWTIWSDSNRAGDALSFRQSNFLGYQQDLGRLDQQWLNKWAQEAPSVLEVLLGMARRWAYYFGTGDGSETAFYFAHLFLNMGFDHFPGKTLPSQAKAALREKVDIWLSRQFNPDGTGSPFPLQRDIALDVVDMRQIDMWAQMNAFSAQHFQ